MLDYIFKIGDNYRVDCLNYEVQYSVLTDIVMGGSLEIKYFELTYGYSFFCIIQSIFHELITIFFNELGESLF